MKLDRRGFVFSLAALSFAPPAALLGDEEKEATGTTLTQPEQETLGHLCEQIIPEDEYPGARELGVIEFINRMLTEAHPDWISVYKAGLRSTDQSSQDSHGRPFRELEFDRQTRLLEKMESGDLPTAIWSGIQPGEFFSMVRSHSMEGYYSHPKWGGNRNKAAWKMIGYDDFWTYPTPGEPLYCWWMKGKRISIRIKRVYEEPEAADGRRVLVDR